jgi:hypothetical protein
MASRVPYVILAVLVIVAIALFGLALTGNLTDRLSGWVVLLGGFPLVVYCRPIARWAGTAGENHPYLLNGWRRSSPWAVAAGGCALIYLGSGMILGMK